MSSQKPGIGVCLRGGGAEDSDINLVYLGRSVFQDTIPKAKKSGSMYEKEVANEVNEHDSTPYPNPFRRHTRSMDCAKRPTPSPSPGHPVKKPKCKHKKKPRIKIIKER